MVGYSDNVCSSDGIDLVASPSGSWIVSRDNLADVDATRILDILLSAALLLLIAPLLIVIAVLVFLSDPGPIFFAHRRMGREGVEFACLKFRTMVIDADQRLARLLDTDPQARLEWARDRKLRNDPRVTSVGAVLRQLSLDELPQLLNVLRGEMSLVGPRPIVRAEIPRYGRYYADYCRVKPGITGLWQVSGRNHVSYRRRVALDVRYARSKTLRLDLWIMARTVPCVLRASGY
jgi:exopolysaccharide production protein ExoY